MMKRREVEKAAVLSFALAVAISAAACEKAEKRDVSSEASPGSPSASASVSAETPSPSPVAAPVSTSTGGDVSSAGGGIGIGDTADGVRVALRLCSPPTGFYKPSTAAAEPPFRPEFPQEDALPALRGIDAISVLMIGNEAGFSGEVGGSFALDRRGRVYAWGNRCGDWSYGGASYAK